MLSHNSLILAIVVLSVALQIGCTARPSVLYHEHFAPPTESQSGCEPDVRGNISPECFGWHAHSSHDGSLAPFDGPDFRASITADKGPDGLPGRAFTYIAQNYAKPGQDVLFWTDEYEIAKGRWPGLTFSWTQYDDNRVSQRLALRIRKDDQQRWFVSEGIYRHPSNPGLRTPFGTNTHPFDPGGWNWVPLVFHTEGEAGPSKPFDAASQTVPRALPYGDITAFGIYLEMNNNQTTEAYGRFDDFRVISLPCKD